MIKLDTTLQTLYKHLCAIITISFFLISIPSCGLFDKEIRQDQHIAEFRHQMSRVLDSLSSEKDRIVAYKTILEQIQADEDLITARKKNILLIEGNTFVSSEYIRMRDYKSAIESINTIINIDPTSPKGYYSRGCIYQIMEQDSLALIDYDKVLNMNAEYVDAYYNRGIIFEEYGDYDLALSDYNKAVKLNPPYVADVYNNRGNTYMAKEQYDKAIEDYSNAIRLDSAIVKAYNNRAGAYIEQNDFEKALLDCNKAISMDSTNINAYSKRASIYESEKMYIEAVSDYEKVMKLDPDDKLDTHETVKQALKKLKPLAQKK